MAYVNITLPTGNPHFDTHVDLGDAGSFLFTFRWNRQDESWYLDVADDAGNAIAYSLHVVLGALIGRRVRHPLFQNGVLVAIDTSKKGLDATLQDFGTRVQLYYLTDENYIQSLRDAGLLMP